MPDSFLLPAILVVFLTSLLWVLLRRRATQAGLANIPGPKSPSILTGHMKSIYNRHAEAFQQEISHQYGPIVKLKGFLNSTMLFVYDPLALHEILLKDSFEEVKSFTCTNILALGPGLLSTEGAHHRKQRKLLNPMFSVNHMRHLMPIFHEITGRLSDAIRIRVRDGPREIDMLGWMGRTALELIGQGGLGYSFDPLKGDHQDPYAEAIKAFLPSLMKLGVLRLGAPYVHRLGPSWLRRRIAERIPHAALQQVKYVVDTMERESTAIFQAKKRAFEQGDAVVRQQVGEGKDILSVLMKANMSASEEDRMPDDEIIAQMSTIVFAGMDTTSNTLARALQLLAEHPDIQTRLRQEIVAACDGDQLPYDELMQLPFLDAVCRETLRLYPAITMMVREARKDTVLPLSRPIRGVNHNLINNVPVPSGTLVFLGTSGWNTSKAIWGEDADQWKPERWLAPLPPTVTNSKVPSIYSNLMTFLGGSRSCIGFKFAELEMKVVLTTLLSSFVFEVEKPIYWNMAGVKYPTVGPESERPALPLKVSLWNPEA